MPCSISSSRTSIRCICCWNWERSRRCIKSPEPLYCSSPPGIRCFAPVPLVTSMNLSPMSVSEVVSAVESSVMLVKRSRSMRHGDFDHAVGLIGTGKFHQADLADADAIHAHRRTSRHAGGIRQVEIDLRLGLEEGAAGEQVRPASPESAVPPESRRKRETSPNSPAQGTAFTSDCTATLHGNAGYNESV